MEDTYGRMIIGVGWPGQRQGCVVRVGIERVYDRVRKGYPADILEEAFAWDIDELVKKAIAMDRKWNVEAVCADMRDEGVRELISEAMLETRRPHFPIQPGVFTDPESFSYLASTLRRYLSKGLLRFNPESELPALLQELRPEDAAGARLTDHPGITGLALACCEADIEQDRDAVDRRPEYAESDEERILE